ncbi:MAG TPA: hypothetical protein VIZ18_15740 [Ktedonobacteraceae bacterium]
MDISKQEQKPIETASIGNPYEWSGTRIIEQRTINVLSAFIIGIIAVIGGTLYSGALLLLQNVLHVPSGGVGILAFVILGMLLMLALLILACVAWIRGMSSTALMGILIGAAVGAAFGAWVDSQMKKRERERVQKNTAQPE